MTISESIDYLQVYVGHLEHINDHTYAEDPVAGRVNLKNPYADLIDAMNTAIACMEAKVVPLPAPKSAVAMLRCLLSYHERVTMHGSSEYGGLRCYSDALRLGIRCIEKVYGLPESDLDFSSRSTNSDS